MLEIRQEAEDSLITIGVRCASNPRLSLDTPLTFRFNPSRFNFGKVEDRISYLQQQVPLMPPGKRARLLAETMRIEAFRASKIQNVFAESGEPSVELQLQTLATPDEEIKSAPLLLMKNTAAARTNALIRARERMRTGSAIITAEDTKLIQGDIYKGVNALNGLTHYLQEGFIRTGEYKKDMNGDKDFRTVHPDVLEEFMHDFGVFLNHDIAQSLHPIAVGSIARVMFAEIHPFEDGNGRTHGIIYETCISCYAQSRLDLCDIVTVTEDTAGSDNPMRANFTADFNRLSTPNSAGEINITTYILASTRMLEDRLEETYERGQLTFPEKTRQAG